LQIVNPGSQVSTEGDEVELSIHVFADLKVQRRADLKVQRSSRPSRYAQSRSKL
jgi:hypothetical protein